MAFLGFTIKPCISFLVQSDYHLEIVNQKDRFES